MNGAFRLGTIAAALRSGVPDPGVGTWVVADSWVPTGEGSLGSNLTMRLVVAADKLLVGTRLRLTLDQASELNVTGCYVGFRAAESTCAFRAAPVQVMFAGVPTLVVPSGGGVVVTDPIDLPIDKSEDLVIAVQWSGFGSFRVRNMHPGWGAFFKSGADASTIAATGYSSLGNKCQLVTQIEVFVSMP